jgi:hypothetical protein
MGCVGSKNLVTPSSRALQGDIFGTEAIHRAAQYQNVEAVIQSEALSILNKEGGLYSLAADSSDPDGNHVSAADMARYIL